MNILFSETRARKILIIAIFLSSLIILLSSCSLLVPKSQRLQYVTPVVEQIDAGSAGEISNEVWHEGDGFAGGSWYQATITGNNAFSVLRERILKIPKIDCVNDAPELKIMKCFASKTFISLFASEPTSENVINLSVVDSSGGR